jgi:hypothetical protein
VRKLFVMFGVRMSVRDEEETKEKRVGRCGKRIMNNFLISFSLGVDMFFILPHTTHYAFCPELADSFENMIHDNVDVYSLEVLLRNAFEFMVMYDALHLNNKQKAREKSEYIFIDVSSF